MTEMEQILADATGDPLQAARKFVGQFRGFLVACERISQIQSIERATREAEEKLAKVRDEMAALQDERDGLAARIDAEIEREMTAKRAEVHQLVVQSEALRKTNADLETAIVNNKAQHDVVRRELADARENFANVKGELLRLRNSIMGPMQ
jgi:chromosome segregation ATPase